MSHTVSGRIDDEEWKPVADLEVERRGGVQVLRINRPEARNALSSTVTAGIGRAVLESERDPEIRAIVVTGTGDRAFCAGADLRSIAGGGSTQVDTEGVSAYMRLIRDGTTTPIVAAANGTAVGGGMELLMACDMVVAADHARFGLPEVKRGLFPAGGGVFVAARLPKAVAAELLLTGDYIDANRALTLGLVNAVVPGERVLEEAIAFAERAAANGPLAVAAIKQMMNVIVSDPHAGFWPLHDTLRASVFGSEDAREGATAFLEKREPVWRGR
jgi:enoyl-CoA hydratase